jgi:hypothetical protein
VTGTYSDPNITLKASYTGSNTSCCAFTYTGTVTDCKSISGNWKNNGCNGETGTFSMTKSESDMEPVEIITDQWPRPGGN